MQENKYLKVNRIYNKLKNAQAKNIHLYIHAPTGVGKTAAVKYFYRKQSYCYMSGGEGLLEHMPEPEDITENVIIFDDISWIVDDVSKKYIVRLLNMKWDKHIIVIGRNNVAKWLMNEYIADTLMMADEYDFIMNETHVKELMKVCGLEEDDEMAKKIITVSHGYSIFTKIIILKLKSKGKFSKSMLEEAKIDRFHYFDVAFWDRWSESLRKLLLSVAIFDKFSLELAKEVTADTQVLSTIEYAQEIGDFIYQDDHENFYVRMLLKDYLLWKRDIAWSEAQKIQNHRRAALYFQLNDQIADALQQYTLAGDKEQVLEMLIQNAEETSNLSIFYQTRKFYLEMPQERVLQEPALMAVMSILYSWMLQPEQSEMWYQKLISYKERNDISRRERKNAISRIAYLEIILPQKGIRGIIPMLKNVAQLCTSESIVLPEFSVTSNLPSIMNGGKDFCEWSKHDKELAIVMKIPIEVVLGKYGVGLVNIALAESAFEKGAMDDYEIMSLADSGCSKAKINGKTEVVFAGVGLLVKIHMEHGQVEVAKRLLREIREIAEKEMQSNLLPNIEAVNIWMALLAGNTVIVNEWLEDVPNENTDFYILDRYRYMIKLRCHIANENYSEAWSLSNKLNEYFTAYERNYLWIENMILRAIISYRLGRKQWRDILQESLEKAEEYHFSWLLAQEGVALKPLLEEMHLDTAQNEYYKSVMERNAHMAFQYPRYLAKPYELSEPLTDMEKKILKLHCEGIGTNEILEMCSISLSTLKFHNGNLYRKIGVKNKQEAVFAVHKMGWLIR